MSQFLFRNVRLLEPEHGETRDGYEVLVEDDLIREVAAGPIRAEDADVIDGGGRVADARAHRQPRPRDAVRGDIRALESVPLTLATARAALLRGMLDRGFTTVRDTGGAMGPQEAVERAIIAARASSSPARRSARPAGIRTRAAAPITASGSAAIAATR
jgi:imidazolonepropionase-like amidohydrolase